LCTQAPSVNPDEVECTAQAMLAPFDNAGDENPYTLHVDLQACMQQLVGIIRTESELRQALEELDRLRERLKRVRVQGNRQYNPAWHMALDMDSMLTVSKATTLSAIERKESRGGHTRDDYPNPDAAFARVNVVTRLADGEMVTMLEALEEMPDELKQIIEDKA
jgi:succinate dehydrogenase / fumarate reductase flavoprotein subunit